MQRGQPKHHLQMKLRLSKLQEDEAHAEEKVWCAALATERKGALSSADRYLVNTALVN